MRNDLLDNLNALTGEQKKNFVTNLLQEMRRAKIIRVVGDKRGLGTRWELYSRHQDGAV